jgi:AAA domain
MTARSMSFIIHSGTKVGKSTLANTSPAPRLLIDAEAAYRYLPGKKIFWDPLREPIPVLGQGRIEPKLDTPVYAWDWETCVVIVHDYSHMKQAAELLRYYAHPFVSVNIDSISEIQTRLKDQLTNFTGQMDRDKWGLLLNDMTLLVRGLRDLTEHPDYPLQTLMLTAMTEDRSGKWRPYVEGQLKTKLPYWMDVCGYYYVANVPNPDPTQMPIELRVLAVEPGPNYEAGNRIQETEFSHKLPPLIGNPTIPDMITAVFGPERKLTAA